MAKKKQSKAAKNSKYAKAYGAGETKIETADLHDSGKNTQTDTTVDLYLSRIEELEKENLELHDALECRAGTSGDGETTEDGFTQMTVEQQPIIAEEVASVIPLLRDVNGAPINEATFNEVMPQLAEMAVRGVLMIRQAIINAQSEEQSNLDTSDEELVS